MLGIREMMTLRIALLVSVSAYQVMDTELSVFPPNGLRFAYPHHSGLSLVAFHYSVNESLDGISAGQWNYDVHTETGGYWIHENSDVPLQIGDVVNYWVYVVYYGRGYQRLGLSWTLPACPAGEIRANCLQQCDCLDGMICDVFMGVCELPITTSSPEKSTTSQDLSTIVTMCRPTNEGQYQQSIYSMMAWILFAIAMLGDVFLVGIVVWQCAQKRRSNSEPPTSHAKTPHPGQHYENSAFDGSKTDLAADHMYQDLKQRGPEFEDYVNSSRSF